MSLQSLRNAIIRSYGGRRSSHNIQYPWGVGSFFFAPFYGTAFEVVYEDSDMFEGIDPYLIGRPSPREGRDRHPVYRIRNDDIGKEFREEVARFIADVRRNYGLSYSLAVIHKRRSIDDECAVDFNSANRYSLALLIQLHGTFEQYQTSLFRFLEDVLAPRFDNEFVCKEGVVRPREITVAIAACANWSHPFDIVDAIFEVNMKEGEKAEFLEIQPSPGWLGCLVQ